MSIASLLSVFLAVLASLSTASTASDHRSMDVLHRGMGKLYASHWMSIAMHQLLQSHRTTANGRNKISNGLSYLNVCDTHVCIRAQRTNYLPS